MRPDQLRQVRSEWDAAIADAHMNRNPLLVPPARLPRQRVDRAAVADQPTLHCRAWRAQYNRITPEICLDIAHRRKQFLEKCVAGSTRLMQRSIAPEIGRRGDDLL